MLLCVGTPLAPLEDIAKQGAAALELANDYTDFIEAARRRKPTTPAAEIQQHLFPPRIARLAGAQLAGVLLPAYEVGGDWFDFVENRDGAWLAIADAAGRGPTAAGLGAAALGALRAGRRSGQDLEQVLQLMNETVCGLEHDSFRVTLWLARWRPATATLSWVNCDHPPAYLVETDDSLRELESPRHAALGSSDHPSFEVTRHQLAPGQRLILATNGILNRKLEGGGRFGVEGIRRSLERATLRTAAATAMAIQQTVTDSWKEPLDDDGTVVVMAVE
jgi:serine phosphatase RsbU (regulator of sigma subunit)